MPDRTRDACGEPDRQEGMGVCVREPHDDPWHWNEHAEGWADTGAVVPASESNDA